LPSKVAMTLTPGCVKQWDLGAQFGTLLLDHLGGTSAFFMCNQAISGNF